MASSYGAVVEGAVAFEAVRDAVATAFGRPACDVLDLEVAITTGETREIVLEARTFASDEFQTRVDVDVSEPGNVGDDLAFAKELARILNQRVLTSAASLTDAPGEAYSALVTPDGSTFLVVEDEDDDGNQYIVEDTIQPAERIR